MESVARRRLRSLARPAYVAAKLESIAIRRAYRARLVSIVTRPLPDAPALDAEVYSHSSGPHVPEQVASMRSFLGRVGRPRRWIVVSDGSHARSDVEILRKVDRAVEVVDHRDFRSPDLPPAVLHYAERHHFGRKLAVEMSLPVDDSAIYTDDDVLYFSGGPLRDLLGARSAPARYLPDCDDDFLDDRMLAQPDERRRPVNGGFMLLHRPLQWDTAVDRLARIGGEPRYFSEQTALHLAMHATGAAPLDPELFVLTGEDRWGYRDVWADRNIALRHYVLPTRFKFWLRVAHG